MLVIVLKVSEPAEAVDELEKEVGFCLRGYVPGTTVVPKRLQIPVDNLADYLRETLGLNDKGIHRQTDRQTDNVTA